MRLIDADALKNWLTKPVGFRTNCEDCTERDCLDCIIGEALDNAPTIEAVPVKHVRWDIITDSYDCEFMFCPFCQSEFYNGDNDTVDILYNYCPNCVYKMDLEV